MVQDFVYKMEQGFVDKVVLVTGAGRGIGRAIAIRYAEAGAEVVLWDKDSGLLEETLRCASNWARLLHVRQVDVSNPDEVREGMKHAAALYGHIDIVVNNAGFGIWKSPLELSIEEWDSVLNTNLRGTFVVTREAALHMPRGAAVVNIGSTRAFMSEPNSEAYAASKGGIYALTHAFAASLGEKGIRVNSISPGWIETGDYDKLREEDHTQHPAGRVGKPDDIARACFYLTDSRNDFLTGINLTVDGGMTHKMMYLE